MYCTCTFIIYSFTHSHTGGGKLRMYTEKEAILAFGPSDIHWPPSIHPDKVGEVCCPMTQEHMTRTEQVSNLRLLVDLLYLLSHGCPHHAFFRTPLSFFFTTQLHVILFPVQILLVWFFPWYLYVTKPMVAKNFSDYCKHRPLITYHSNSSFAN